MKNSKDGCVGVAPSYIDWCKWMLAQIICMILAQILGVCAVCCLLKFCDSFS